MQSWAKLASSESIVKTIKNLKANGINPIIVKNAQEAKRKVFEIIPQNAEAMNMSSVTMDTAGISREIQESGKYNSVKNKLMKMNRKTQGLEMRKLGSAPEYAVGSVHAITENGEILIASNSGSQLPAYVYGAAHVIWVAGTQKIVKDLDEGMKRIYDYVLPLESKRLKKNYGIESNVSKFLIINKEITPNRLTLILVKEKLGF